MNMNWISKCSIRNDQTGYHTYTRQCTPPVRLVCATVAVLRPHSTAQHCRSYDGSSAVERTVAVAVHRRQRPYEYTRRAAMNWHFALCTALELRARYIGREGSNCMHTFFGTYSSNIQFGRRRAKRGKRNANDCSRLHLARISHPFVNKKVSFTYESFMLLRFLRW